MAPHTEEDLIADGDPPCIDPYETLGLEPTATADQVKSAYRKAALKNHPDKVPADEQGEATEKFQAIAFAYAILSDPTRRRCFDQTGSTAEAVVDADDFNWSDFYRAQFADAISADAIRKLADEYKGSEEERADVLAAYEEFEGDMDSVYEHVILSSVLDDDERFRAVIDAAVTTGDAPEFPSYKKESKKKRQARIKAARNEAAEAEKLAKELGVHDVLNGKKKKSAKDGEADLAVLIQRRQGSWADQLDKLEQKFAGKKAKPRGSRKRGRAEGDDVADGVGEPTEEEFQKARADLENRVKKRQTGRGGSR